ncbi:MAG: hypothetical protein Q7S73_00505 [bacterium]|nr:hypothetical protein [bacterium]
MNNLADVVATAPIPTCPWPEVVKDIRGSIEVEVAKEKTFTAPLGIVVVAELLKVKFPLKVALARLLAPLTVRFPLVVILDPIVVLAA